jgi:hypothetical protein
MRCPRTVTFCRCCSPAGKCKSELIATVVANANFWQDIPKPSNSPTLRIAFLSRTLTAFATSPAPSSPPASLLSKLSTSNGASRGLYTIISHAHYFSQTPPYIHRMMRPRGRKHGASWLPCPISLSFGSAYFISMGSGMQYARTNFWHL